MTRWRLYTEMVYQPMLELKLEVRDDYSQHAKGLEHDLSAAEELIPSDEGGRHVEIDGEELVVARTSRNHRNPVWPDRLDEAGCNAARVGPHLGRLRIRRRSARVCGGILRQRRCTLVAPHLRRDRWRDRGSRSAVLPWSDRGRTASGHRDLGDHHGDPGDC